MAFGIFFANQVSASSNTLNFQSKIVNVADGTNVVSGTPSCVVAGSGNDTCDFRVRIYDASSAGTLLFSETHSNVEIGQYNGIFNLSINSVCASTSTAGTDGNWTSGGCISNGGVNFSASSLWIEIGFDPAGGGSFTETFSRVQIKDVASARYAVSASYLGGIAAADFVQFKPGATQTTSSTNSLINLETTGNTSNPLIYANENGAGTPDLLRLQTTSTTVFQVGNGGAVTMAGDLINSSTGTIGLFNTNVTTLNVGGATTTLNLAGGSGSTGCTIDGATGNLACSGTISGTLTIADDSLDYNKFEDTMDLDAGLTLNQGSFSWIQNFTGTTTGYTYNANSVDTSSALQYSFNGLTSGTGLSVASSSTTFTGNLVDLRSTGNSSTTTGNVLYLNVFGANNRANGLYIDTTGSSFGSAIRIVNTGSSDSLRIDDVASDTTPFVLDAAGNLSVGGNIGTSATSIDLLNTTATTINFGGAATTLNVGISGASGTLALMGGSGATGCTITGTTGAFGCTSSGTFGTSLISTTTSFDLINTTATTLNIGGAATTLNVGISGASGTLALMGGSGATGCTINGTTGSLSCTGSISGTGDTLDYDDFEDTMDLDADLILNQGTFTWVQNFTGATTVGKTYNATSLTSGTALRVLAGAGLTTNGELIDLDLGTSTAGNALNINTNAANYAGTGLINITSASSTAGTGILLTMTGSTTGAAISITNTAAYTGTVGLARISTTGITSGTALGITSGNNLTTNGELIDLNMAASTAGNGLNVTTTGAYTGTGLVVLTANTAQTGTIQSISGTALTSGVGLSISSTGTGMTSGSLLRLTTGTTGAVATNGIVSITATGNYTSTSNVGLLTLTANATQAGTVQSIFANALTTGVGLSINSSATGMTTASLLSINASGANTAFTGNLASISFAGNNASNTGDLLELLLTGTASNARGIFVDNRGLGASVRVDDVASDTTPFIIDAAGQVGIGYATPGRDLDVLGAASINGNIITQAEGNLIYGRNEVTQSDFEIISTSVGSTWTEVATNLSWRGVAISSSGKYQTATNSATGNIYQSIDYGASWTARDSARQWNSVDMSADGKYQSATVTSGQIYTSTNYGETWTARDSNRSWRGISISADGRYQAAVDGAPGLIYVSSDFGVTWSSRDSSREWRDVSISSDGKYMTAAGGSTGTPIALYISTNYGATWTASGTSGSRAWTTVALSSDGKFQTAAGGAAGGFTQIYTSSDYGATWTARDSSRAWGAVAMTANGKFQVAGIAGSSLGHQYVSRDYGVTWSDIGDNGTWNDFAISANGKYIIAAVTNLASTDQLRRSVSDSTMLGGNLAIGTSSAPGRLTVADTGAASTDKGISISNTGLGSGLFISQSTTPGATTVNSLDITSTFSGTITASRGALIVANASPGTSNTASLLVGLEVVSNSSTAGAVTNNFGIVGTSSSNGSGTTSLAVGVLSRVSNNSTGTISNAYGLLVQNSTNTGGGSVGNNFGIRVESQTTGTADYGVYIGGADTYALWVDSGVTQLDGQVAIGGAVSATSQLSVTASNTTDPLVFIHNTGNSSAAQAMHVNGCQNTPNANCNLIVLNDGDGTRQGRIRIDAAGGVSFLGTSDRRVKQDIVDSHYTLQDLLSVQVRDYKMIASGLDSTGFIAQELYEIYPYAVDKPLLDSDIWAVDYGKVTPLIIKGVQDLNEIVEGNTRSIADLHIRDTELLDLINGLTTRVAGLETRVGALESSQGAQNGGGAAVDLVNFMAQNGSFSGNLNIAGNTNINGKVYLGNENIGEAKILAGATEVTIVFDTPFETMPIIQVTPQNDNFLILPVKYVVSEKAADKFKIKIDVAQLEDLVFNWSVSGTRDGVSIDSNGVVGNI